MPINLLEDDMKEAMKEVSAKKQPMNLLQEDMKPPAEALSKSLAMAPFRVVGDVVQAGFKGLKAIPGMYEKSKTEIPGLVESAINHPSSVGKQFLAGTAEKGERVFNLPHNVTDYLANRLNLFPKGLNEKIQMGRMPDSSEVIDQTLGKPKYPGEELMRGIGRNLEVAPLTAASLHALNPMRLTGGSIARDVARTGQRMQQRYSGNNGLYDQLFNEGQTRGINQVPINPQQININTIGQHAGDKYMQSVEAVLQHPTLANSQRAVSDLGKLTRALEKRETLTSSERDTLNAARNARDHISHQMFRDTNGNLHQDLQERHQQLQHGYRHEVVPYSTNNLIKAYRRGELSSKQLADRLAENKFNVQRGAQHPSISRRAFAKKYGFPIGAAGLTGVLGKSLYDYMNKGEEE